jgi:potassium-transporting ATPase potassium-binding subunit
MTGAGITQVVVFAIVLVVLAVPLGAYMARVYTRPQIGRVEGVLYRWFRVNPDKGMTWKEYATALIVFNVLGILVVYALQRLQGVLPGNPLNLPGVDPRVAFNTSISFGSNTNWQAYGGETTMSFLVQAGALAVQNFVSAATGMAVLVALARAFRTKHGETIGNFWVDLTRSTIYILIPLSVIVALLLIWQGVPQMLSGMDGDIAVGPVASQIAIKQLGTNGGGFYNANSAHPLENPSALSNFIQCISILLIPAALCFTFGRLVKARRQGIALLATMALLVVPFLALTLHEEQAGNPALAGLVDQADGNMEGKEVRFGVPASALWATATTAASNGSVNSMHDSYTPLGGMSPMVMMAIGEVAFGGVGSGLYGLLIFAIVAVFIAGLMVGRTPEFLGKKIEAFEMKMASLAILVPVAAVLICTAIACMVDETYAKALANHGPHGFSEVLYAFLSQGNNNGSAFAGLTANGTFYTTAGGIAMWVARYWIIIPTLAIAGSLARKKTVPPSAGTLPTDGVLFVVLLAGVVILVGALSFIPALALGPIAEHLAFFT